MMSHEAGPEANCGGGGGGGGGGGVGGGVSLWSSPDEVSWTDCECDCESNKQWRANTRGAPYNEECKRERERERDRASRQALRFALVATHRADSGAHVRLPGSSGISCLLIVSLCVLCVIWRNWLQAAL